MPITWEAKREWLPEVVFPRLAFNTTTMTEEKRKSFIFYSDWYDAICGLDDSTALEVCKSIMACALGREEPNISETAKAMMMLIRPQIKRDIEKWMDIKAKRKNSGSKGGLAKQANATKCYQMVPNGSKSKQNVANLPVNVNDNVNVDNNSVILKEKEDTIISSKKEKRFVKPTIQEIQAHILEKGYTFDAEAFYAFYESNGWKVGRNPMKNWKMACTTWDKNRKSNNNNYGSVKSNTEKFIESVKSSNEFSRKLHESVEQQASMDDGDNTALW